MRNLSNVLFRRGLYGVAAAGAVLLGSPAFAQSVEELTVTARIGPDGQPNTLSQAVDYSDLDLTLPSDQAELKSRVKTTARDLCQKLGEDNIAYAPIVPSCRDAAYGDVTSQVNTVIAEAPARKAYAAANAPAPMMQEAAVSADAYVAPAAAVAPAPSYTVRTVTNGPVPDTPESRARYGGPLSHAGARTAPAGD